MYRTARAFISSSFRDFGEERNLLVKQTFQRLRRLLAQRDVALVEVDLRWGITSAQSEGGKVVPICLSEIDKCRPYFICMLGERYGWILDDFSEELKSLYPWMENYKGRSVTELEIRHAVLNHTSGASGFDGAGEELALQRRLIEETVANARFYFRDPAFVDTVSENLKRDFVAENDNAALKMRNLKKEIETSLPKQVKTYTSPQELAEMIYEDLEVLLERDFPIQESLDLFSRERQQHEQELLNLTKIFVANDKYDKVLAEYLESKSTTPLVVSSEDGGGKSSLMAHFCQKIRKLDPDSFVVPMFAGLSAEDSEPGKYLYNALKSVQRGLKLPRDLPSQDNRYEDVISGFSSWLEYAARTSKKNIVIAIDSVDQLNNPSDAFPWLPREFPAEVKAIFTCGSHSTAISAFEAKNWTRFIHLEPLTQSEKLRMLEENLIQFRKTLSEEQTQLIVSSPKTESPLFLKCLVEELRIFGHFESLTDRILDLLEAKDVTDLYVKVIDRMEADVCDDEATMKAIKVIMTSLSCVRTGLTEAEIMELAGIPFATWSPIFLTIQSGLMRKKEGRLTMYSKKMREAVERKYLPTLESQRLPREAIITFAGSFAHTRKMEEIPYQYQQLGDWKNLTAYLADLDMVTQIYHNSLLDDFNSYWKSLEPFVDPIATYKPLLEAAGAAKAKAVKYLASFFRYIGKYHFSQQLVVKYLEFVESQAGEENLKEVAETYTSLAWLHYKNRNFDAAEEHHRKSLAIHEKIDTKASRMEQTTILNSLGVLYRAKNDLLKAEETHLKALELKRKEFGEFSDAVSWSLLNLGVVQRPLGKFKEAEENILQSIQIFRSSVGAVHLNMSLRLNALARLYVDQKEFPKAEEMFLKDLELRRKILGPRHADLGYPLSGLGELYFVTEKYAQSEDYFQQAIEIQSSTLGEKHPVVGESWYELGLVFDKSERKERAKECFLKALQILTASNSKQTQHTIEKIHAKLKEA